MNTSKTLFGFIAGAAIGGLAAALMTPQSGEETRQKIADKAHNLNTGARDRLDAGTTQAKAVVEERAVQAKDAMATVSDRLTSATSTAKDAVLHNVEAVSYAASQGAEAYREKLQENGNKL